MSESYEPPSDFLKAIIAEDVPLSGGEFGEANLRQLIALTRDPDRANRDWATLLLAQQDVDTVAVRDALIAAARDEDDMVRGEAVLGLAMRDPPQHSLWSSPRCGGTRLPFPCSKRRKSALTPLSSMICGFGRSNPTTLTRIGSRPMP